MTLDPGQILGNRYRVVRLLGQGGFGSVYRAWDILMHGACAVKENRDISPATKNQFEREARMLFQLRHPCLPRVYDQLFIPDQGQYLVMDFVEGEDLDDILARQAGPLPESQVLFWVSKVVDALEYLHTRQPPIIHRDIKPANILITPDQQVYLVDFGIAKVFEPNHQTSTGARALTAGYAPPEQYSAGQTDATSDVYALGATLYHLLTFKKPPDSLDLLFKSAPPLRPAHDINPAISLPVSLAIRRAMELEKSARFQYVREFETAMLSGPAAFQRIAVNAVSPAKAPPAQTAPPTEPPGIAPGTAAPSNATLPVEPAATGPRAAAPSPLSERAVPALEKTRREALPDAPVGGSAPLPFLAASGARPKRRALPWVVMAVLFTALSLGAVAWFALNILPGIAAGSGIVATGEALSDASEAATEAFVEVTQAPPEATQAAAEAPSETIEAGTQPPAAGDAVFEQGIVEFFENFDDNQREWDSGQASGEYWVGDYGVADGAFRFDVTTKESMVDWILAPFNHDGSPFLVSVDTLQVDGSQQATFGVLFNRYEDENGNDIYYLFTYNPVWHEYNVSRQTADGWQEMFDWTFSNAIHIGAPNRLSVFIEEQQATFYINGKYVNRLEESGLDRGRVGIIINVYGGGQSAKINFDNFEVRTPANVEQPNLAPESVGPKMLPAIVPFPVK